MKSKFISVRRSRRALITIAIALMVNLGHFAQAQQHDDSTIRYATFGGGCFWCLEAVFEGLPGVKSVVSGYAGGHKANPIYKEVCSGLTGHAEVIQIAFDPEIISYEELLDVFWQAHDPTTLNRQGPDFGTQYRSIILYHDENQRQTAAESIDAISKRIGRPVVTELKPLTAFYPAEQYHQDYYRNNSDQNYCKLVIKPKLEKLQKHLERIRNARIKRGSSDHEAASIP